MSISFFNGDCLEVMKGLPDASVDCFICDLPYGCLHAERKSNGSYGAGGLTLNKETGKMESGGCAWDVKLNLELFWEQVKRLRKADNSPCLMFCTTKFGIDLINSNPKEFRYDLVWNKQRGVSFLTANKMPMRSHEMIYIFSKAGSFYNRVDLNEDMIHFIGRTDKNMKAINRHKPTDKSVQYSMNKITAQCKEGFRSALSVINNSTSHTKGGHPTEKPMALYKFLIERYCPADGVILDPTAGSFNSCFTAYELGRDAIGIEKDDGFFKKAKARAEAML